MLGTHRNTVRNWIKQGLPTIDMKRPRLIHGLDLANFLKKRRERNKRPCPPGYIYCVRCRAPKLPAERMVDYVPLSPTSGNLRGICPDCETLIHRRISLSKLSEIRAELDITFPQGPSRISESPTSSVNCDFKGDGETNENA